MRRAREGRSGGAALADREAPATIEELRSEIERATHANRAERDPALDRRLLRLRHRAGIRLLEAAGERPDHPRPDIAALPEQTLPDISPRELTPGLLRAAILRDGCLLVRGVFDRDAALRFADQIERSFNERDRVAAGGSPADGYYDEFAPEPPFAVDVRPWVQGGGGVLAADSPALSFEMFELFEAAGLPRLVHDYLGEPPLVSVHKTTLRKAEPTAGGAWHQDGAFMGNVRALNLWVSLSHCGDVAPGLDLVPRRLDRIVATGTSGAAFDWSVSQVVAEESAADRPIERPIFEPGDALFFDELFLHQTALDASMTGARFAIENWFFGPSAFPADYAPLAV